MTVVAGIILILGLFFMGVAAIGVVRLPDLYCRLHVTGILDTLGAPLVLLAFAMYTAPSLTSAKLLMMIVLLYLTCPLIGHLLARAALEDGYKPVLSEDTTPSEEQARDKERKK